MSLTNEEKIKLMAVSADFNRANTDDINRVISDYKEMKKEIKKD